MQLDYKIEGLKELDEVLKKLPAKMQASSQRNSLRAAARVIQKEMKNKAPVRSRDAVVYDSRGNIREPGFLKNKGIIITRGRTPGNSKELYRIRVGISREAFYGMFPELGTRHQPAQPYLRPAWEEKKEEALATLVKKLAAELQKNAKKLTGPLAKSGLVRRQRRK
ncbi:MAG: HK97 gp10 family phage protein [Pseudomonadales bacterium]|nr:HK97 gp10 family phage protein [Pseudomonadales bacterium]